jgi:hypothetical protein
MKVERALTGSSNETQLVWVESFQADNGEPLKVVRWLAYAVGPFGRRRVFPALSRDRRAA